MTFDPPHSVTNHLKLARMVQAIKDGVVLPPIVVCGYTAFCGSHRIEAYRVANNLSNRSWHADNDDWDNAIPDQQAIDIDNDEYEAACKYANVEHLDDIGDYNLVCAAIRNSTDREDVRDALADQVFSLDI